jgi:uncharacterized protein (DUF1330 family)
MPMAAYVIFIRDRIKDPKELAVYGEKAQGSAAGHSLKLLAFYGASETWEGSPADGVVILEFPTAEAARAWYHSPAYQAAKVHRERGADYRAIMVEGTPG